MKKMELIDKGKDFKIYYHAHGAVYEVQIIDLRPFACENKHKCMELIKIVRHLREHGIDGRDLKEVVPKIYLSPKFQEPEYPTLDCEVILSKSRALLDNLERERQQ